MDLGKIILDNIEYVGIVVTPIVVFAYVKLKKIQPRRNNLTSRYIKYAKQEDAINKRIKGKALF